MRAPLTRPRRLQLPAVLTPAILPLSGLLSCRGVPPGPAAQAPAAPPVPAVGP